MNQINLDIKNLNSIKNANINLKRINVFGGINKKVKSVFSKLLYSCLNATTKEGNYYSNLNNLESFHSLCYFCSNNLGHNIDSTIADISVYDDSFDEILKSRIEQLKDSIEFNTNLDIKFLSKLEILELFVDLNLKKDWWYFNFLNLFISSELNENFLKDINDGELHFYGKIDESEFEYRFNNEDFLIKMDKNDLNQLGFNNVIYLDSVPFIFQNGKKSLNPYHINQLGRIISSKVTKNIDEFDGAFEEMLDGDIIYGDDNFPKKYINQSATYLLNDMPTDIKLLSIMQLLVNNNHLEKSFLILDDFDYYLNSQNIEKLTELLMKICNRFNLSILINTVNPEFVELLDIYSNIYGLSDDINFYLVDDGEFKLISNDNLGQLYDSLVNFS